MIKTFYLSREFDYTWFECVNGVIGVEELSIEIIAIDKLALASMTQEDHDLVAEYEYAEFLFKVNANDLRNANASLDSLMESVIDDD